MQKTAYEMLFSDWSSDVCSSDLFQGGEPTLRLDLIAAVIERCTRFAERQFVVCTNLQSLSDAHLALFDRDDVYIPTRSEERGGGKEGDSPGRSRWWRTLKKKKHSILCVHEICAI